MTLLEQAKEFYRDNVDDGAYTVQQWMAMFAEAVMPKWTYCKDAMPSKNRWYLVSTEYNRVVRCEFDLNIGFCSYVKIIAWMPLPEPAK